MSNRVADGAVVRRLAAIVAVGLAAVLAPAGLAAQVGHDPSRSPFRDVVTRQSLTLFGGWFSGNTASAGVGAQSARIIGGRFQTRLSGPIELTATLASIASERLVINPSQPVATRVSGPVDLGLVAADLGLALVLTGAKSWHRMAPYIGVGVGVIVPTEGTTDPGGYKVASNFTIAPTVGLRVIASRRYSLQVEARDNTIRYEWPRDYFVPVDASNNPLPPVLDPLKFKDRQVTHNLTLSVGLSYHFNF